MPELPEVETARSIIESTVVGSCLTSVTVRLPKLLRFSPIADPDLLIGARLEAAERRAKVLVLRWSNDLSTLIHLRLSGQITVLNGAHRATAGHPYPDPAGEYPHKTTHLSLEFNNDYTLHISDLRQFGWLRIQPSTTVEDFFAAQQFGPEANAAGGLDVFDLATKLARRSVPIKIALLDQKTVAGIGNIYVDEALHRARIHPATPANAVPLDRLPDLVSAIAWSMESGLAQGGARIVNNIAYPRDGFPEVHARKGEACPVCGDTIIKVRVGQRGTYLCPTCQPES